MNTIEVHFDLDRRRFYATASCAEGSRVYHTGATHFDFASAEVSAILWLNARRLGEAAIIDRTNGHKLFN